VASCKRCPRFLGCYTEQRLHSGKVVCECLRPTRNSWRKMIERCANKNHAQYKDYGGRGITVCERWLSFSDFVDDMKPRPKGKTLDGIDNDGGYYYKENCRWATREQQAANRRKRTVSNTCPSWHARDKLLIGRRPSTFPKGAPAVKKVTYYVNLARHSSLSRATGWLSILGYARANARNITARIRNSSALASVPRGPPVSHSGPR
jgi:hypothetical protein